MSKIEGNQGHKWLSAVSTHPVAELLYLVATVGSQKIRAKLVYYIWSFTKTVLKKNDISTKFG